MNNKDLLQSFDKSDPSKKITNGGDSPWFHVTHYILLWKHIWEASVFTRCSAGCCEVTTGRGGRTSRWWDCWAPPSQHQACDLQASWGWSKYSGSLSHWTSPHGTAPGKNKICRGGERDTRMTFLEESLAAATPCLPKTWIYGAKQCYLNIQKRICISTEKASAEKTEELNFRRNTNHTFGSRQCGLTVFRNYLLRLPIEAAHSGI